MCLSVETRRAITTWMKTEGVSRADLARRLDMGRSQVTSILNGHDHIGMEMANRIVRALGCRIRVTLEKR